MKGNLKRTATGCTLVLAAVLALQRWAPSLPSRGMSGLVQLAVAQARGRNLQWWGGLFTPTNGYYENLIDARDDAAAEQTLITRLLHGKLPWSLTANEHHIYQDDDFLLWKAKPNLNFLDLREGPTETNSFGFFDTEHPLRKPVGVRRIAVLGDSITRGWGVNPDKRFETVLERRLNRELGEPLEMLNFAVPGYRLTQIYDVALENVPQFHPDVYLVVMTDLCMTPRWDAQIVALVQKDRDVKYDFLRKIVKESGLQKGDSEALGDWKLAPYRISATHEMLLRLKTHAEKDGAQFMVALVPAVEDSYTIKSHFYGVSESLEGLGIPVINALDSFEETDVENERTNWYDPHPNDIGHRLIADDLYRKLHEQPKAWSALTGQPVQLQRAGNPVRPSRTAAACQHSIRSLCPGVRNSSVPRQSESLIGVSGH
jgi:hypothetical protein